MNIAIMTYLKSLQLKDGQQNIEFKFWGLLF